MRTVTIIFIVLSCTITIGGLFPCLGWINWVGIPCSGMCAILGLVGTASKDTPETDKGVYLAALIPATEETYDHGTALPPGLRWRRLKPSDAHQVWGNYLDI
jgi:hypothetical protein